VRNVHLARRRITIYGLRNGKKIILAAGHHSRGQGVQELEDARVGPLVLAESLIVHEQVADKAVAVYLVNPLCKLLGL